MNKFYMNGKLIHKASDHNTKRCEVEKWVFLPHSDFERLKANPYQEHEAITAARDLMYADQTYHCENRDYLNAHTPDIPGARPFRTQAFPV